MEYNYNNYFESIEAIENPEEGSREIIVCSDENLMKYMVEVTEILLESIWRSSQIVQPHLCPLNDYLTHVIRQSKISLYTLKCSIIYFVRMSRQLQDKRWKSKVRLFCGRRMFLGSVIIASKYLYDRTYSNSMWAKILSLDIKEVNQIQMDFLDALNYDLYISKKLDSLWSQMLENFITYLKARHKEEEKEKLISKINRRYVFPSPKCSHGILDESSSRLIISSEFNEYPNSPISPETYVKNLNSFEYGNEERKSMEGHEMIKNDKVNDNGINYNSMNSTESNKLLEYRPYVKVLIQVIFMYSKNNALPIGEKKIIELPKLATTPDLLFVNPSHRMNNYEQFLRYSGMMSTHQYSLYRKKSQLHGNILNNKNRLNTLKYSFKKVFPNHHLLMGAYASYNPYQTSGYYSDTTTSNHQNNFHVYKKRINYQKIKEADDYLCGSMNLYQFQDDDSNLQRSYYGNQVANNKRFKVSNTMNKNDNYNENYKEMSSSSSGWESSFDDEDDEDDSSTLLESSSDEESENNYYIDDNNTPKYNGSFFGIIEQNNSWKYEQEQQEQQQQQQKQNSVLMKENEKDEKVLFNFQDMNEKLITPISKTIPKTTLKLNGTSHNLPSKSLMACSINKQIYHEKIIYPNM